MNYLILTETDFFVLAKRNDAGNLNAAYNDFVKKVISLCCGNTDGRDVAIALAYTETELQYVRLQAADTTVACYVSKARTFIHEIRRLAGNILPTATAPHPAMNKSISDMRPALKWTGNAIDLVEMIYGISEMGCVNNGKMPLKQLAPLLYKIFGVESKDCYRFYTDIKRRKSDSRTYFLDRMQEKLNERMRRDDELERMRR